MGGSGSDASGSTDGRLVVSAARTGDGLATHPLLLRPDFYVDTCRTFFNDPALQFLHTAYYRPGALHFNLVDITLLLYVSLIAIGWGEADTVGAAAGQALLIAAGVSVVLWSLWVVRPQKPEEKYQSVVDAMVLVMAVVQAVVNALNTAVRLKYALSGRSTSASGTADSAVLPPSAAASDPLVAAFQAMCYVTVMGAVALLTAIVALFGYVLWHGAHLDEIQRLHAQEVAMQGVMVDGGGDDGDAADDKGRAGLAVASGGGGDRVGSSV